MSIIAPIGISFMRMYVASVQDLSYQRGFMGKISEAELKSFIEQGKNGDLVRNGNSWFQEFGSKTITAFKWNQVQSVPTGTLDTMSGELGAFQYKLVQEPPDKKKWRLEINVRWKIDLKYSSLGKYTGSSKDDIIASFLELANKALYDYWVRNNLHGDVIVKLVSEKPDVTVELVPKAIGVSVNEHYDVTIFPDDEFSNMGQHPEVVQFNSSGHVWFARETATFSPIPTDGLKTGNGPHEFGHMMGLPHDIDLLGSYMYSGNDKTLAARRYKFGRQNTAWAAHYRIMKYWLESIMTDPELLDKKVHFIIQVGP